MSAPGREELRSFWEARIGAARALAAAPIITPWVDSPFSGVRVLELEFSGDGGDRIGGWVLEPPDPVSRGVLVQYPGYGGGRGTPEEWFAWTAAGFRTVVMDVRGQAGVTGDPQHTDAHVPGFLTEGLGGPDSAYAVRLVGDAIRCVEVVAETLVDDGGPIVVGGFSQGAWLALAAAALSSRVAAVIADSPFLCSVPASTALATAGPYLELAALLARYPERQPQALDALHRVDAVALAPLGTQPAMVSAGGLDEVCPPEGVEALVRAWAGEVDYRRFDFRHHVLPRGAYFYEQLEFIRAVSGAGSRRTAHR